MGHPRAPQPAPQVLPLEADPQTLPSPPPTRPVGYWRPAWGEPEVQGPGLAEDPAGALASGRAQVLSSGRSGHSAPLPGRGAPRTSTARQERRLGQAEEV